MRVPLITTDFLDRASFAFGATTATIDEPDQPAKPVGTTTYGGDGDPCARVAGRARRTGRRRGRTRRRRQPQLRAAAGTAARGARQRPGLRAGELPPAPRRGEVHRRAQRRVGVVRRPRAVAGRRRRRGTGSPSARSRSRCCASTPSHGRGVLPRRTRPRPSTTPPAPPRGPRACSSTHRNIWLNAVTFAMHTRAWEGDVYMHVLPMFHCNGWGMPFGLAGLGVPQVVLRKVDGRRDPAPCARPRRHADVRRTCRVERGARRGG